MLKFRHKHGTVHVNPLAIAFIAVDPKGAATTQAMVTGEVGFIGGQSMSLEAAHADWVSLLDTVRHRQKLALPREWGDQ